MKYAAEISRFQPKKKPKEIIYKLFRVQMTLSIKYCCFYCKMFIDLL